MSEKEIKKRITAIEIIEMIVKDLFKRNKKVLKPNLYAIYKLAIQYEFEIMYGEREIDFDCLFLK